MYVTDLTFMSRLFNTLVQKLCEGGVTCILRFVGLFFLWRAIPFICDELHLKEIPATGFAEELQRTIDNSIGSSSYFN